MDTTQDKKIGSDSITNLDAALFVIAMAFGASAVYWGLALEAIMLPRMISVVMAILTGVYGLLRLTRAVVADVCNAIRESHKSE